MPTDADPPENVAGSVDPQDLATTLRVLASLRGLSEDHADFIAVRQGTSHMFKAVKQERRREKRSAIAEADKEVVAATATGASDRIDDETRGLTLEARASAATAGTLLKPRACYICKQKYSLVDAFYHQLCPECAAVSHAKREAHADLTGKRALLTGGRAKIGMHIALRLLRDGAHTTITTRFPKDAVRRFAAMDDAAEWLHRLHVVGIDLRDPAQVVALADAVGAEGPLDILINNAAQTVRRSPGAYAPLADAESVPIEPNLWPEGRGPTVLTFGHTRDIHPHALEDSVKAHPLLAAAALPADGASAARLNAQTLTDMALTAGSSSLARLADGTAIDAGGLLPDLHHSNSWVQAVGEVDALEMLEVQLCNETAPFILISKLRGRLAEAARAGRNGRAYVVNVSAMEGVFGRGYKGPGHPHTNMAKAAVNMLTRTSAREMFETDRILMTSVDTGWITDERPHPTKVRLAEEGFHAPLDLVDGAARVYDPIVRGEAGEDLFGVFLKDYKPSGW
ncbi:NAD(P)-dependent dehydrogenase (short-subunit alcohol dehydrogenase family) [Demequina lutea]|uniref:NAD(P)-dependent dehydrogenase (Short-subunit alcohol dehydrogenase family) n=1 Tax=Demequina lutea TaxID=431489 RepID=A0A7Z0CI26_9MICO|nr:SDR family NAD(P)-dependent oxidoreductase [Demequina lutea]NYI41444.1 NAD(P)-dependent dehydrogenase (short-subunit alcohol dehydrogenase family) [Demequina lutea]